MSNSIECEKKVIDKLISAFSNTLSCYPAKNDDSEVLEKILQILLEQNNTLFENQSNGDMDMRSIVDEDEFVLSSSGNMTDWLLAKDGDPPNAASDVTSATAVEISTEPNRLHQLEIIKVFVLIFVISIILLTTCRMVFQLFIRFRPEKPPLA